MCSFQAAEKNVATDLGGAEFAGWDLKMANEKRTKTEKSRVGK